MSTDGEAHVLRFEVDQIDVTMFGGNWKWDPDWEFVDKAGHHHWAKGDPAMHPTLVWVIDDVHFHDGDECSDGHYACSLCWEPITPGQVAAPNYILGMKRWYLDDAEISAEQARAMLEASLKLPR